METATPAGTGTEASQSTLQMSLMLICSILSSATSLLPAGHLFVVPRALTATLILLCFFSVQPRASVSLIRKGWVPFRRGKGVDPHSPPSPPPSPLPPSPPPPSPPPAQGLIFCFPTPCLSFPSRKGRPQPRDGPLLGTQTSSFQFPQSKWCNTKWAEAQWGTQWCPPPHTQSGASVSPRSSLAAQHSAHTPLWGFSPHYSHRNPPSFGYGFLINALLKGPTAPLAPSRGN